MDIDAKIYLDYAATTPVDERVLASMLPYFTQKFGNPSSVHFFGQQAESGLELARERVAARFDALPEEIIFTSGGTESDNLAIRGTAFARRQKFGCNRILTTPVEHHAVLHTVEQLASLFGFDVEFLPVDSSGKVDPDDLRHALGKDVAVVSIIYANNEIGTINPMEEIAEVCAEYGVPLHTDAVQAAAHLPMRGRSHAPDMISIGAHKFYGPKGVGALYIRQGIERLPIQTGGGQEFNLRAGTQNVPYIVGLAEAFDLAQTGVGERANHYITLRDHLIEGVLAAIANARLTGHRRDRLPNHASFVFQGVDGNRLLMLLDGAGFACSSGSACKVGDPKPSDVLKALGLSDDWALGSLRVTLGAGTTLNHIHALLAALPDLVKKAAV
jgi:cysteine desulfurase